VDAGDVDANVAAVEVVPGTANGSGDRAEMEID